MRREVAKMAPRIILTHEDEERLDLAKTTCVNRLSAEYEAGIERLHPDNPLLKCLNCSGKNQNCKYFSVLKN